ncbi:MAG: glycoprotease [Oscillospiraceae bacterium]
MFTLGIDTSNYATSLAVYSTETKGVVCDIKQLLPVKQGELGLRQSDALFHHIKALPKLLSEINEQFPLCKIDAVGVSTRPRSQEGSYMPCFLAGCNTAVAISAARGVPLIEASHQDGHINAALYACGNPLLYTKPVLIFHISGGTTELLLCEGGKVIKKIGESTDLYAGQAVDRIGVRLGMQFPAGAQLSALAEECKENIKPKVSVKGTNCSLSGVENQCIKLLLDGAADEYVAKYCLSYIAQTVLEMISSALSIYPNADIVCAGGVMSSKIIKTYVQAKLARAYFVDAKYSSDNAIGIAIIAANEV